MNFQNSYISIFNNRCIHPKIFVKRFFCLVLFFLILSVILKYLDINMNSNDLIKNYQLKKINSVKMNNVETIIVGDSSSGNAINAKLFSKLSKSNTISLSLTGSWGIIGSLGILKLAYEKNPKIKNVIIMQTLDIWNRPFVKNSIHEFFPLNERLKYLDIRSVINDEINVKELKWFYEYVLKKIKGKEFTTIDYSSDYLSQKKKKIFNSFGSLEKISEGKVKEFKMLEEFCSSQNLNCIYVNGPMHQGVIDESNEFLVNYKNFTKDFKIRYVNKIFYYVDEKIGDSEDHILPQYKNEVTKEYYKIIKKLLI